MKTRFLVSTVRTITLHAHARAKGWDEDCGIGPLDFTDVPESYAVYKPFDHFMLAVDDARRKIEGDFFKMPRIYEEVWSEADEDWKARRMWDIEAGAEVSYDDPTHEYEEED